MFPVKKNFEIFICFINQTNSVLFVSFAGKNTVTAMHATKSVVISNIISNPDLISSLTENKIKLLSQQNFFSNFTLIFNFGSFLSD